MEHQKDLPLDFTPVLAQDFHLHILAEKRKHLKHQ